VNIGIVSPFNPYYVRNYISSHENIPQINSNATSVNTLVVSFLEQGHNVIVFTTTTAPHHTTVYKGKQLEIHVLSKVFHPKGMSNLRIVRKLRNEIKKCINNIDVLHAHWTYEYAASIRRFEQRIPTFCTIRDWCPYQCSLAVGIRAKYSWWINSLLFVYVMKSKSISFIANSAYTYKMVTLSYHDKQISCIPNSIQREFILNTRKARGKERIYISICQNVEERRKNIKALLKAFQKYKKQYKESKLIIVGSYSDKWKIHYGKFQLLHGVYLAGKVQHDEIFPLLDQSCALIHPSFEETFGNIFLEAMARRVVCIGGYDAGAVPEILGEGKRGILCNVRDINSILNAMKRIDDVDYIEDILNNASSYIKEQYADDVVSQKHIELYKKKLKNTKTKGRN
jgi:glycosyltransferase involved in cell wall biosynthesis